jgi:hypothetical protein
VRTLLIVGLVVVLAGCASGQTDVTAEVKATSLANVRKMNLFTPSLLGEEGKIFNSLLAQKLTQRLTDYLHPGARWTLTIVHIDYTTPHFKQKEPHYKLTLDAEMTDMYGKQGWHATVGTSEIPAESGLTEEQVRERLVDKAVEALFLQLPLGRIEMGEEKLK